MATSSRRRSRIPLRFGRETVRVAGDETDELRGLFGEQIDSPSLLRHQYELRIVTAPGGRGSSMQLVRSPVFDDPRPLRRYRNRVHKGGGHSGLDGSVDTRR